MGFCDKNRSSNPEQKTRPCSDLQKKACYFIGHRVKIKKSEKRDKYLDLNRELRKLWNMRVTVIPIVVGALGMAPKRLEREQEEEEIRRGIETIQIVVKISQNTEKVQKTRGDLLSFKLL